MSDPYAKISEKSYARFSNYIVNLQEHQLAAKTQFLRSVKYSGCVLQVVCANCSYHTLVLEYDVTGRPHRVCDECHQLITESRKQRTADTAPEQVDESALVQYIN